MNQSTPEIPGFKIFAEVGRGTTGVVYQANDLQTKRVVALKLLMRGSAAENDVQAARFLREAEVLAIMTSKPDPNIPSIYAVMQDHGRHYHVREFVEGETLDERVIAFSISALDGVQVLGEVAGAISRVHARGIMHRNLHPSNILIAADGTPKLIGFGRAGFLGVRVPSGQREVSAEVDIQGLQKIMSWLFWALHEHLPIGLEALCKPGSVLSAAAFGAAIAQSLRGIE